MDKQLRQLDTLFKALGDETRLRILGLLSTGEVCVCHIHESLKIPQSKASRHLAYLRRGGLVETRRDGLWIYYRLVEPSSPVLAGVQNAIRHSLTHSTAVRRDLGKLERHTGCCLPSTFGSAAQPCCAPLGRHPA